MLRPQKRRQQTNGTKVKSNTTDTSLTTMSPKAEDPIMVTNEDAPRSTASEIVAAPSKDASVASTPKDSSDVPAYEDRVAPEDESQAEGSGDSSTEQAEAAAVETEEKEADGYQNMCAKIELPQMPKLSCFDLSTIACCGLGSTLLYSDDAQTDRANDEKAELEKKEQLENDKAIQIQKVARARLARKTAETLKAEKEAAAAAEAAAKEAALAEAVPEAAPEQAPSNVEKTVPKKSFFQKLAGLFSGCKKSDSHVVSQ